MTLDEMRRKKTEKGYSYAQMAELSGVPLGTIQKIFSGETKSPRYDTLEALEKIFREETPFVSESIVYGSAAKRRNGYTIKDYYELPEDTRMELIDGVLYDMSAPNWFHQKIAGEIYRQIANFIMRQGGECEPAISPLDVQLDCDEHTMVQPDVIIMCDRGKIRRWGVYGAPDFVLEVVSPSTRRKDYAIKTAKYCTAGVREFWILDPYKKMVTVYDFEGDNYPAIFGLNRPIPVGIYEGKFAVEMDVIKKICEDLEQAQD